jgi:curved DNA-binding protein CbpA
LAIQHAKPETFDPYRTLQVLPSAHRDLIEQAYWVLVGRTRARGSNSSSLGRLNDAYGALINADRRAAYDLEHGLTKLATRSKFHMPKRPIFSRNARPTTRLTHYQLLDIDFEAVPEIVDTAYVFHKAQLRSDAKSVYLRALIEDAHAVLASPKARAAYDQKVAPRRRINASHQAASPAAELPPPPPAPLFPDARVEPAVVAEAAPAADADADATQRGLGKWVRRRVTSAREHAQERREHRAELREQLAAAEQKRLAELVTMAEPPHDVVEAPRPAPGRAGFRFTDGPQAGQTISLTENSLILGASDAADVVLDNPDGSIGSGHVRVWRRDDEYILHQLDSFSTTFVNGERLDLRLAILEPGDEIRIGPHTLIFDAAEPEARHTESSPS